MSGSATACRGMRAHALIAGLFALLCSNATAHAQLGMAGAGLPGFGLARSVATRSDHAANDQDGFAGEQPFGLAPAMLADGNLVQKWRGVQERLATDLAAILICATEPSGCNSPEAMEFLGLVAEAGERDGLARFGEINRAVNLSIRFMSDMEQFGTADVWSPPLQTLQTGLGDCEDYAILKLAVLRAAGVDDNDLRLVILHNDLHGDDHAVAAARIDGAWRVLDSQRLFLLRDRDVSGYRAAFVMDTAGVHVYADPETVLSAAQPYAPGSAVQRNAISTDEISAHS